MLVKFENPTIVHPQSFPNGVATLHSRIKWADPSFVPVHQLTVDVNDQIPISVIKFLKHLKLSFRADPGTSHRERSHKSCGRITSLMNSAVFRSEERRVGKEGRC